MYNPMIKNNKYVFVDWEYMQQELNTNACL